ncbi:MAG TPA: vitamin K epoxide reductase family protein [Chlamydiales bacterium]|nr:vitamin K epoxide reductase family protein [Chlamydiales bacterium]
MDEIRIRHNRTLWTSYASIWLGFWLLTTHIALGYSQMALSWSDGISGILLIVLGICSLSHRHTWALWAIALIGVWLQFAPLFFWAKDPAAYLNDTLVGTLIIGLSILLPSMPDVGPSVPPGWSYNPSSWPQRLPVVILGTIGWFISRYLAAEQLGFIDRAWDPLFGVGTMRVISSHVSHLFPISDAGLGAMAYTLEVLLALKGGQRRWHTMPWMVLLFGLIVVPLGLVTILLIILQPVVVGAWCALCLFTAFCMTIMIAYSIDEMVAVLQFLCEKRRGKKSFWEIFWKGDSCSSAEVDKRSPMMDASFPTLFSAASWGVALIWNLFLSVLLGAGLMLLPWYLDVSKATANSDHIAGALAIVISVISMAEVMRKLRYLNYLIGAWVLVSVLWFQEAWLIHGAIALLLILLSFRRGPVKEKYGSWEFF